MHSIMMLETSRLRAKPPSSIMKPACIMNTRKAAMSTQTLFTGLTLSDAGVALVPAALRGMDPDWVVAALAFTAVVVLSGRLGLAAAGTAAVTSFLALNYWFIPITGTFTFESLEDLLPLVAFGIAGL